MLHFFFFLLHFFWGCGGGLYILTQGNRGQVKRRVHARAPLPPRPAPPPPQTQHSTSPTAFSSGSRFFYLCSLHIGIRQGLSELGLGDLESVAPPRGSPQLGGQIPVLSRIRFLYRVSTGDYSEIIGSGWHLSSPGGPNTNSGGFFWAREICRISSWGVRLNAPKATS
jgi:hypothetical protein